jgi:hypothetical protein
MDTTCIIIIMERSLASAISKGIINIVSSSRFSRQLIVIAAVEVEFVGLKMPSAGIKYFGSKVLVTSCYFKGYYCQRILLSVPSNPRHVTYQSNPPLMTYCASG